MLCQLDARNKWGQFMRMSDMELYRRLGRLVAKRRDELDLTQGEVAEKIGLSRASLANLENGRQRIMVHQLFALVNALKLESILDLVPATWEPAEPLPEIKVAGASLTPEQQSGVERLIASAVAEELVRKRSK
jgi:transcriptional regulator with XRE-family HTH domain